MIYSYFFGKNNTNRNIIYFLNFILQHALLNNRATYNISRIQTILKKIAKDRFVTFSLEILLINQKYPKFYSSSRNIFFKI